MARSKQTSALRRSIVGILWVFANYVNFLIFAQFGFLQRVQSLGFGPEQTQKLLGAMGVTGLVTSFLTPAVLRRASAFAVVRLGFITSILVVLGAIASERLPFLFFVSGGIGFSVGLTSVTLSVLLRRLFPARQIGLNAALGTGLAYFVCNIPWLFEAPPVAKGIVACATLSLSVLSTFWLGDVEAPDCPAPLDQAEPLLSRPAGFALITGMFLALIWLDSAAFYIIQNTPHLKATSWGGPASQLLNGLVHLAAALAGGWLIDRGKLHAALILAYLIITSGILLLQGQGSLAPFGALFYVVAVSVYSTGLSAYAALEPEGKGAVPIRWRAGILYAISGWLGSALGVGMAQTLRVVPPWFMAAAGVVMGAALVSMVLRGRGRRGAP